VGFCMSLTGRHVLGNLTGTAVLLGSSSLLYLMVYRRARLLAPPDTMRAARVAAAPLSVDEVRGDGFARVSLALCVLMGLASAAYAMMRYEAMPDRVATLASLLGASDALVDKSIVVALVIPSLNLVLSTSFALMGLMIVRAKRSVRGGSGGHSAEAQDAFRRIYAQVFGGMALFICLLLSMLSVELTRVSISPDSSLGIAFAWAAGAMIVYSLANLIRILRCYGQGGALLEAGSEDAPLTGGLADNTRWVYGVFYIDKHDPSFLVESRFGIGYTLNLGNRHAVLSMGGLLVLILGLLALTLSVAT
jgi:uncharacterized membrane protein